MRSLLPRNIMETLVLVLVKGSSQLIDTLQLFLSDEAPLFEEEVEPPFQKLFLTIESLPIMVSSFTRIEAGTGLLFFEEYGASELLEEIKPLVKTPGFDAIAVHFSDEAKNRYYHFLNDQYVQVKPQKTQLNPSLREQLQLDWPDDEDQSIIASLMALLK